MSNLEHTSIGVAELDRRNEELLGEIVTLQRKLRADGFSVDRSFRREIVRLIRKFRRCFAAQERWIGEHDFSILELQKRSHAWFLREIVRAVASLESRRERAEALASFLEEWFIRHIRTTCFSLRCETHRLSASADETRYELVSVPPMPPVRSLRWLPAVM